MKVIPKVNGIKRIFKSPVTLTVKIWHALKRPKVYSHLGDVLQLREMVGTVIKK